MRHAEIAESPRERRDDRDDAERLSGDVGEKGEREVRLVCDYKIREWSDFTISKEELNKYTMSARFYKSEGDSLGKWFVFYYLLDADTPRYQLEFAYQVNFEEGTLDAVVYSWEDAQHSRG